jgi:hypothetical protein
MRATECACPAETETGFPPAKFPCVHMEKIKYRICNFQNDKEQCSISRSLLGYYYSFNFHFSVSTISLFLPKSILFEKLLATKFRCLSVGI